MSDTDRVNDADKLNSTGEEPEAESGAGYGSHAPVEEEPAEKSAEQPSGT